MGDDETKWSCLSTMQMILLGVVGFWVTTVNIGKMVCDERSTERFKKQKSCCKTCPS